MPEHNSCNLTGLIESLSLDTSIMTSSKLFRDLETIHSSIHDGDFTAAHRLLVSSADISKELQRNIKGYYNSDYLSGIQLEWTHHGIWKTFRFYTDSEKTSYLERCLEIIAVLQTITPHVCFGFGSVLGFTRGDGFIPHDDDMDLIVAFSSEKDALFSYRLNQITDALSAKNFRVYNLNRTHLTSNGVDIFVGFYDSERNVSWFPSSKNIGLKMEDVFPPREISVYGLQCVVPANSVRYLEAVYGISWRHPDKTFSHPWRFDEFSEFT
jgi:hypothetical protein